MNTEALEPQPHVFLATHHPAKMFKESLLGLSAKAPYDESQFLKDFLTPEDFIFVAIQGEAGTGKSHLIRWLSVNIPSHQKRHVLLIPKAGTNLKDIVKLILEGMDGSKFDDYREKLSRATASISTGEAKERLLDNLAIAMGPNRYPVTARLTQTERDMVEELPILLRDDVFRRHLLKEDGTIDKLVTHVFGNANRVERVEERRAFTAADIFEAVEDHTKAGADALAFYQILQGNSGQQQAAVDWMNKHLDEAIAQVLNLTGEDLLRLMLDVRESLADQGMELVILIEDFAKLQGIDRQLLEALLVRPHQPNRKPLCAMRTAMALTTGYLEFEHLPKTVIERIDFRVNMDVDTADTAGVITADDLTQFTSRYLNAIRLEEAELVSWADGQIGNAEYTPAPNACKRCDFESECHPAFGSYNEMGLYPFTPKAISQMYARTAGQKFSPRSLINRVLKHTLETYGEDLRRGNFPPAELLYSIGRSEMSASLTKEIEDSDPLHAGRRKVLIELWTKGDKLINLDKRIHEAFSLPELSNIDAGGNVIPQAPETPPAPSRPTLTPGLPAQLEQNLQILDAWQNQTQQIPQTLTNKLRDLIFRAVVERIEWDAEHLLPGTFSGKEGAKPFKPTSINFVGQQPQFGRALITLTIPGGDDVSRTEAALALQGLLLFEEYKNWKFTWGGRAGGWYFRHYAGCLDQWSKIVVDQIRRPVSNSQEVWDPVPAVVELLAIGTRLAGRPAASNITTEEQVNALFVGIESVDVSKRSLAWVELFDSFSTHRANLLEIIKSRTPCTKGGNAQFQVVDASQFLKPLRAIRKTWKPSERVPAGLRRELESLWQFREKIDSLLDTAIEQEKARYLNWYESTMNKLGEGSKRQQILGFVNEAMTAVDADGGLTPAKRAELETVSLDFKNAQFENCLAGMRRIRDAATSAELLLDLSSNYEGAMRATSAFIEAVDKFLATAKARVEADIRILEGEGDIQSVIDEIGQRLDELHGQAIAIRGGEQ